MNFKKIIIYAVLILAAIGYWYMRKDSRKEKIALYDRFATLYAETSVLAELYRNEPDKYIEARDSIYHLYGLNAESAESLKASLERDDADWGYIWAAVNRKTDTLVRYYLTHPVTHAAPDSADTGRDRNDSVSRQPSR